MKYFKLVIFGLVALSVVQGEGSLAGEHVHKPSSGLKNSFCCFFGKCKDKPSVDEREPLEPTIEGRQEDRNRITIDADGTVNVLGPGTTFTTNSLSEALSSVTSLSLSKALGLTDKTPGESVDIADVFTQLLLAQSLRPENGAINYETAIIFLKMWDTIPLETIKGFKSVCFLMDQMRPLQAEGKLPDINVLTPQGMQIAECDLDRKTELTWIGIILKTFNAVEGDTVAAKKIVRTLTHKYADFQGLKDSGVEDVDNVKIVIDKVVEFAELVRSNVGKVPSHT